ncbi:MAG: hypothetical protein ACRCV9_09195, partial [Burkholderiaceae bacterium]
NQVIDDWRRGLESISDFLNQQIFAQFSSATPQERLAEAQRQFATLLAQAQSGNAQALKQLPAAARLLLEQASGFFSSGEGFVEIERFVRASLSALQALQPAASGGTSGGIGGGSGGGGDTAGLNPDEIEANRRELAQQLAEYVRQIVSAQGTSLAVLSQQIGFNVGDLVRELGVNLGTLSVETATALAGVAASLGVELSELAGETGVSLGLLSDQNSFLNDALERAINALPNSQGDKLRPFFEAISNATTDADANVAIGLLEDAVIEIGGDTALALAPYLENVDPPSAQAQLLATQEIARRAGYQVAAIDRSNRLLADIERAVRRPTGNAPPGSPPTGIDPPPPSNMQQTMILQQILLETRRAREQDLLLNRQPVQV